MPDTKDFYESRKITEADWVKNPKNILLVVPNRQFELKPFLEALHLSKWEVAITHPKEGLTLFDEIDFLRPKLVLQIGGRWTKKYPAVNEPAEIDDKLLARIHNLEVLADSFVSLHHHDEFSVKDGLGTVNQLTELLQTQRRSFCCITNHGSIGGWIRQHNACKAAGVKAIYGIESYFRQYRGDDPELKKKFRKARHLILLARTEEGFYNLIQIHNDAQLNGFYYFPCSNSEALKKWGKGLVATSSCIGGIIPQLLLRDRHDEAVKWAKFYRSCFDEFYIELSMIEFDEQIEANRRLIKFAQEMDLPMVLANDSHYLFPEHGETHDLIMLINQHKTIHDKMENPDEVWQFSVHNLYYRTTQEMEKLWREGFQFGEKHWVYQDEVFTPEVFNQAMANTREIALKCEEIKLDSEIKLPSLYPDSKEVIRQKVFAGLKTKGYEHNKAYVERAEYELEIINRLGWNDYFLIAEKIVSDTVTKYGEFSIGMGRGSGCGCIIAWMLGLTYIDPIKWGLLFSRFLDDSRRDPPDLDIDFSPEIRDWVKAHVVEIFGEEHVCSVGTYTTYATKAVILDVARALGYDVHEANEVTKRLQAKLTLEDDEGEQKEHSIDDVGWDEIIANYPELKQYFEVHPDVLQHVKVLRNQNRNLSTHAGGVIISDLDLRGRVPVYRDKKGKVVSAWAESGSVSELSAVGLIKYDILGSANLPIVAECVKLIEQTTGKKIRREEIPIDDREAIKNSSRADLVGIFQLENPETKPIADKVELEGLNDVSALTSLIRPGPKDKNMHLAYAERKHGAPYEMPEFLREQLKETYGVMVYQEQCCSGSTMVRTANGVLRLDVIVKKINKGEEISVACLTQDGTIVYRKAKKAYENGKRSACKLKLDNGMELVCTEDHKVLTSNRGWVQVQHLLPDDDVVTTDDMV